MSTTPSFRLPFTLPDDVHPAVAQALRYTFNGLVDANQAITVLKQQQGTTTAVTPVATPTVQVASSGGSVAGTIGKVNQQTAAVYTSQASDFGALVLVNSASPFAYTLNSGLVAPYYFVAYNFGSATITFTPSAGAVNNASTVTLLTGQMAIVFFDGTNWWVAQALLPQTIASAAHKWLNSYSAVTGLFTASQPLATDINGTGLQAFANNAAAIAGGLVAGNLYRTGGDPSQVCVVF